MSRYLVTGGAGFIGSHLVEALVAHDHSVRVLDNFRSGHPRNLDRVADRIELLAGDVTQPDDVATAVRDVDAVFHLAALASVPLSVEDPLATHEACATGTLHVLRQAQAAGVRRVVYASSSSVYGDRPGSSKRETDLPKPLSPYAAAKFAGEAYCQAFFQTHGLETVCLRYFNVFGPRQDPSSAYSAVIPRWITALVAGRQPLVFGDGRQSRDFTFVANVVQANLLAVDAPAAAGGVFNIANGRSTTLLELLEVLRRLLDVDPSPRFEPSRSGDVRESLADITLARHVLGYDPQVTLEDGLRACLDYYRSLGSP